MLLLGVLLFDRGELLCGGGAELLRFGGSLNRVALVLFLVAVGHDAEVAVILATQGELTLSILANWLARMLAVVIVVIMRR